MLVDVVNDADNRLAMLRVTPRKPFVYHSGSAWSLGNGGFRTRDDWDR